MNLPVPQTAASFGRGEDDCWVPLNGSALHDLIGPANQLRSMADLVLARYQGQLDDEVGVLLGFIQTSSDHLQRLLSGLQTYTRIVGQREPFRHFSAHSALAGALSILQQPIDENGAAVSCDPLPEVYGDANQICYVFTSLIENSIKFRSQHRPEIYVTAMRSDNDWLFSVRDNGVGIDARHNADIFGVFRRVHNDAYPGAGVGLAATRRIIERHGSRIWVESSLGHGATFLFYLPGTAAGIAP